MWNTDELSPEEVEALIERTAADAQADAQADAEPTIVDHDLF